MSRGTHSNSSRRNPNFHWYFQRKSAQSQLRNTSSGKKLSCHTGRVFPLHACLAPHRRKRRHGPTSFFIFLPLPVLDFPFLRPVYRKLSPQRDDVKGHRLAAFLLSSALGLETLFLSMFVRNKIHRLVILRKKVPIKKIRYRMFSIPSLLGSLKWQHSS